MNRKRFRIGSVAILFAVIVVCVAIFAVLTVVTANADLRTTEQYGNHVQTLSRCQSAGAVWLKQMYAALDSGTMDILPEGTTRDGSIFSTEITCDNVVLSIELELTETQILQVRKWSCHTIWEESGGSQVWIQPEE